MEKNKAVIIKDTKDIKNIFIQVDIKKNTTSVFSSFSSWENLALLMESLSVTAQKCVKEGISKKKVYGAIKTYLMRVLGNYEIINDQKELK